MRTDFFELHEAQLFRLLKGFFGEEQVVPFLTLQMICGEAAGDDPVAVAAPFLQERCLMTILDEQSTPHLVIEFSPQFSESVDLDALERNKVVKACLQHHGILHISIDHEEFSEVLHPQGSLTLVKLLQTKLDEAQPSKQGVTAK